ncbi:MAG: LysR family transcriptional regulator [Gammaproteobacteria bacterium]|nr:LysR family transcriptional regulator [Gammaproteobacteria bacterium]
MTGLSRRLDLNLLVVFDVLWAERSVSRTARRLHRTQSAVSLALERLRDTFGDPLFTWNGREMQPSPRAEALAPRVRAIIDQVNATLEPELDDPRAIHRDFTIATADYIDWLLGAGLMARLETEAPNLSLYFVDVKPTMTEGRRGAETDLFIVPRGAVNTAQMSHAPLFRDRYVCVAARDNPRVYEGMSIEEFVAVPQATYTAARGGLYSHETRHLAELGVRYRNLVLTPHYMALPMIVSESGGVAIMQERLARFMGASVPLKLVTPPVDYPELEINLYWHPVFDDDPTHRWLREQIIEVSAGLQALPERDGKRTARRRKPR